MTRTTTKIILLAALLVVLSVGVAVARDIQCTVRNCEGTQADDTIIGNDLDQAINGHRGNDVIFGGGGDDRIDGGQGDDALIGEAGCDELDGGAGVDLINAKDGDDCNQPIEHGKKHEIVDAKDGEPNDDVLADDGLPDEIICDNLGINGADDLRVDALIDVANGHLVTATGATKGDKITIKCPPRRR